MLEIKFYIFLILIVYFLIVNLYYLQKYFKNKVKSFGNKNKKKKFLLLYSPIFLFFIHSIFSISLNFYNDLIINKFDIYDQRFNIVNDKKYEINFLVNLYDKQAKKWVPFYDNNNFRFSPIINILPKSNNKYFVFLDKKNDVIYDKISFVYLNDYSTNKYPDTLINAINFNLPSNPIKVYNFDFYKNKKSLNKTKKYKVFYGLEALKLVFYIFLIILFVLFSLYEKHQIWKFVVWFLTTLVVTISSFMIYNLVVYLALVVL